MNYTRLLFPVTSHTHLCKSEKHADGAVRPLLSVGLVPFAYRVLFIRPDFVELLDDSHPTWYRLVIHQLCRHLCRATHKLQDTCTS